jgi:peptidoglycan/LPS O-acetylase OafA/YrhL
MKLQASKKRDEILPLTSVRGIAALWVVSFHLVNELIYRGFLKEPGPIIHNIILGGANFAVDVFFILSGYILAETYGTTPNSSTFLVHRVARVFPLHVVILSAMVIGVIVMARCGIAPDNPEFFSLAALPYFYTLTSVWFGMDGWNGPTWSLNAELAAYLAFPSLQWAGRSLGKLILLLSGLLIMLGYFALLETAGFKATGVVAIGRGLLGFGAGMIFRLAIDKHPLPHWVPAISALSILVIALIGAYTFAIFPAAALIVALGSPGRGIVLLTMSAPVLIWLGRVSFAVYLLHNPLLIVGMQLLRRTPSLHSNVGVILWIATFSLVLMICSEIARRYIEIPARREIRRRWELFQQQRIQTRADELARLRRR